MYKLRDIAFQKSGEPIKGLTCPSEIATLFENSSFSVSVSGTCIVYTSGPRQTMTIKEVEKYKYEDCRIK